jgi:hypothetical protein
MKKQGVLKGKRVIRRREKGCSEYYEGEGRRVGKGGAPG